jgi:8-oxo-dGTP pyrophosphatase MutT (NUDIX family)
VSSEGEFLPERLTARVLLLDENDRLLLMKGRFPGDRTGPGAWFTVGGGVNPGETVAEAAAREAFEETGIAGVTLGPVVWYREGVGRNHLGERLVFKESYFVARCVGAALRRDGWEDYEHELIDELRWWTVAEIAASRERIFPERLAELLPDILAGRFPSEPLDLRKL